MAQSQSIRILAVSGSLRARSLNTSLLHVASDLAGPGVSVQLFGRLSELPHFDEDLEAAGDPPAVAVFKRELSSADALLIATPEYNGSIPGALKNAIDWASRPMASTPFRNLPVGLMGASPSRFGAARAQDHLRDVLGSLGSRVLEQPQVRLARAPEHFDEARRLTDSLMRTRIVDLLRALAEAAAPREVVERLGA